MKRYPKEVKEFIEKNVVGTTTRDLVKLVNAKFGTDFTDSKMKSYKTNNKLKSGTPLGLPAGRPTELYPEEIKDFIENNHKGIGPKKMTALLNERFNKNFKFEQIRAYYKNNKLNSGLDGRFRKGQKPVNSIAKGQRLSVATEFKKGQRPANWVPIGSERVNGDGYVDVKVADGKKQKNWKGKHILIWEEHNGPVPDGHVVIFGDGNNRNFDIKNLILVSRSQLATLNKKKLIQNDADLTRTAVIMADLYQKISQRKKR